VPEIVRQCYVPVGAEEVWQVVSAVDSLGSWFTTTRKVEKLDGPDEGVGRVQRVRYKSGARNATVDAEVIEWQPNERISWRQLREFLGTKQAPLLARNQVTSIVLEQCESGTLVRVESSWEPVGLKGELAETTVLRPRTEKIAMGVLGHIETDCTQD